MDGLALLCNLCADGPVTLRRLRPHVRDLATLEHTPAETLAEWIQCSVPQARAFAEEAAILRHRIGEQALAPEPPRAASSRRDSSAGPELHGFAGFGTRPIVEPARTAPVDELPDLPEATQFEARPAGEEPIGAVRVSSPDVDPEADGDLGRTLLRVGLLPGLDAQACGRLSEAGVRTVRALAEGAGLALSRRTEIPYSRLLGLARAARGFQRGEDPTPVREETLEIRPLAPPTPAPAPKAPAAERAHDPFALPLVEPESAGPFG